MSGKIEFANGDPVEVMPMGKDLAYYATFVEYDRGTEFVRVVAATGDKRTVPLWAIKPRKSLASGRKSPASALAVVPKPADAIRAGIKAQLIELASGDLSIGSLERIGKLAMTARMLLQHVATPEDLARNIMPPGATGMSPYTSLGSFPAVGDDLLGGLGGSYVGGGSVMSPAPAMETFGANALRGMVDAIRKAQEKPKTLVDLSDDLKEAKKLKNTKLVKRIEALIDKMYDDGEPETPAKGAKT